MFKNSEWHFHLHVECMNRSVDGIKSNDYMNNGVGEVQEIFCH